MTSDPGTTDRLGRRGSRPALPFRTTVPVLGVPISFETNAPEVLSSVRGSFGAWEAPAPTELLTDWTGRVRLVVTDTEEPSGRRPGFSYEIHESEGRLTVSAGKSVGHADSRRGEATALITASLIRDTANFQYGMIQALTLFVITGRDRYPLHAATLVTEDTIVLLMGNSGVGKSTLSYALQEAGMTVLGEDVAYLSLRPAPRVWAAPGPLHLMPDATRHFAQARHLRPSVRANGKEKVGISLRSVDPWQAPRAQRVVLCLLARGAGAARWSPAGADDLTTYLASAPAGFNRFLNQLPGVARQLTRFPIARVELSSDPRGGAEVVLDAIRCMTRAGGD